MDAGDRRTEGVRRRRWPVVLAAVLALLVVGIRLAADPLATGATRRVLAGLDDYQGTVRRVHVRFFPPGSTVDGLKLFERGARGDGAPLLYVEHAESRVAWRPLLHGVVEVGQRVAGMKMTLARPINRQSIERGERLVRSIPRLLRQWPRAKLDRMELSDGELLLIDTGEPGHPRLWLHDLSMVAENLVTRPPLAGRRPATAVMKGQVQRSGALATRVSFPQGGSALTFDVRMALEGLETAELHDLLAPRTDLQAPEGGMSTYASIQARDGTLSGWVRAILTGVEITPAHQGFADRVKAWLADKSVELFSDHDDRHGGERLDKTVPVRGRLDPHRSVTSSLAEVMQRSMWEAVKQSLPGGKDEHPKQAPQHGRRAPNRR
jgi:hypothetical protein